MVRKLRFNTLSSVDTLPYSNKDMVKSITTYHVTIFQEYLKVGNRSECVPALFGTEKQGI